ncbi:major facilitator superfamily [Cystoisospora suis]|uniref:Major facilitator superfamily n=1 Tax=Cystoisospora suis TaxID=483139 RepID=A0A2C6KK91_9APIC|nr:major facilitator superfamily [Cystoisospora suis]
MPSEFSMEYTRGSMPPSVVVIGECVEARSRFPDDIDEFLTDRELFLDDTQDRDLADSFAFPSDISTASCSSPFRSPSRVPSTSSVGALHCSSPLSTGSGESGEEDKQTTSPKPRPRTRGRRRAAACSKGRCVALVADKVPVERTGAGGAHDIESNEELLETGHSQGAAVSQYEDTPDTSGYLQGGEDAEETARLVLSRNSSVCSSVLGTPTITEDEDYFYFQKKGRLDPARSWLEKCRKSVHAVVRILWMRKSDEASWQTHNEKAEEDLFARRRREVAFKQQASETCWRDLQREPRLTLLLLATATAFSTHNLIAPNMSRIAGTFHFSNLERDQKIGGNLTTLYYIPGCLGALCVGIIGDAINSSRLLYGVLMLTSASTFLTSFVQTYEQLAALRVFSGLGIGGVLPLSYSVLGSWYEPEKRASSSAFLMSACGLGGFVGQSLAALLGRFDWRWPFAFTSFPLFLVSQLFFFYGICEGSSLGLRGVSVLGSSERKRRWVSLFRVRRARQEKDESWSAREGAASQSSDSVEGGFFLQHVKRFFLRGNRKYAPSTSSQVSGEDEEFRHEDQEQAQLTCSVKGSDTQPDVAETVEHCAHGNADESGAVIEQEGSCEPQKSFGSVTNLENELEEKGQQHRTCGGRLVTWAEGEQNEVKVTQNVGSTHKCRGADSMTSAAGVGPGILTLETAKAMLQTKTNLLILIQVSYPQGHLSSRGRFRLQVFVEK